MVNKYPPNKNPRKQPNWPDKSKISRASFLSKAKYIWNAWNANRMKAGFLRVDPPDNLNMTTMRPAQFKGQARPPNTSISFAKWQAGKKEERGPLLQMFDKQDAANIDKFFDNVQSKSTATGLSDTEAMEVEAIVSDINSGKISIADFDNTHGAGPSGVTKETTSTTTSAPESTTEMVTQSSKRSKPDGEGEAPAAASAASGGTGKKSSSDGGFDSAQGPISVLPKGGYKTQSGSMMFSKVHRMKSFAIPYWKLADTTAQGGAWMTTTPLAEIPWDRVFFYLSEDEFQLLPAGSYIRSVHIDVMQTVAQTGYPTGGTTATVATTNHPKVLCIGNDLIAKCRGGLTRNIKLTAGGVPESLAVDLKYDDFVDNQYGTDQSTATLMTMTVPGVISKIPYYNYNYFCMYQPTKTIADANGYTAINQHGFEYFQNYITEINANDVTWDSVASASYDFKSAPIGEQYPAFEILFSDVNQSTGNGVYYNARREITGIKDNVTYTEKYGPSSRDKIPIVTYKSSTIEKGSHFVKGDAAHTPARQPSFHIGLRAIEKALPSLNKGRATEFVVSNIEFEIKATMIIDLPSYPNRFTRPKAYNTSVENAAQGTAYYPVDTGSTIAVTHGLYNSAATAPALSAVDARSSDLVEPGVLKHPTPLSRPIRSSSRIAHIYKKPKLG